MNAEASGGWAGRQMASHRFMRSSLIMVGCNLLIAALLCVLAIATRQNGSNGPWGVLAAAGVCIVASWTAEAAASVVHRVGSSLVALLIGMALRLMPPLMVCLILGALGGGKQHLAFVVYLLAFYLVTLTFNTSWAIERVTGPPVRTNHPTL